MYTTINDTTIKCCCGSNLSTEDVYDAHGNFIARVCTVCKNKKLSTYIDKNKNVKNRQM